MLSPPRMPFARRQRSSSSPQAPPNITPADASVASLPSPLPPVPAATDMLTVNVEARSIKTKRSFFTFKSSKSAKSSPSRAEHHIPSSTEGDTSVESFTLPVPDVFGPISLDKPSIYFDEESPVRPRTVSSTLPATAQARSRPIALVRSHSDLPPSVAGQNDSPFSSTEGRNPRYQFSMSLNGADVADTRNTTHHDAAIPNAGILRDGRPSFPNIPRRSFETSSDANKQQFPTSFSNNHLAPTIPPPVSTSPADTLFEFTRMDFPLPPITAYTRTRTESQSSKTSPPTSPTSLVSAGSTPCTSVDSHFNGLLFPDKVTGSRGGSDGQRSPASLSAMSLSQSLHSLDSSPVKSTISLSHSATESSLAELTIADALINMGTTRKRRVQWTRPVVEPLTIPAGRKSLDGRSPREVASSASTPTPTPSRSNSRRQKTLPVLPPPNTPLPLTPSQAIAALNEERRRNDELEARLNAITAERDTLRKRVDAYRGGPAAIVMPRAAITAAKAINAPLASDFSSDDEQLFDTILANFTNMVREDPPSTPEIESDEERVYKWKQTPPLRISPSTSKSTMKVRERRPGTASEMSPARREQLMRMNTSPTLLHTSMRTPPSINGHARAQSNPEESPRMGSQATMGGHGEVRMPSGNGRPSTARTTPASPRSQIPTLRGRLGRHGASQSVSCLPTGTESTHTGLPSFSSMPGFSRGIGIGLGMSAPRSLANGVVSSRVPQFDTVKVEQQSRKATVVNVAK